MYLLLLLLLIGRSSTARILQPVCQHDFIIANNGTGILMFALRFLLRCYVIGGASENGKSDLLTEIKMLKQAGGHANIVSLIGASAKNGKL